MPIMQATIKDRYPKAVKRAEVVFRIGTIDSPYHEGHMDDDLIVDFDLVEYEDGWQVERVADLERSAGSTYLVYLPSGVSPLSEWSER